MDESVKKVIVLLFLVVIGIVVYTVVTDTREEGQTNETEKNSEQKQKEKSKTGEELESGSVDPIAKKMEEMTLEEKIGQLFISGMEGTEMTDETAAMIEENALGGVILFQPNLEDPDSSLQLVNDLKKLEEANDIPLFISVDQEGGQVERLPGLRSLKSAGEIGEHDRKFAYENGQLLAELLKAYGMNLNFAPVLDVNSNPNNPIIADRAFGDNAEIVSEMGISMMQGIQDEGVITSVKHFPGHGDTDVDSHEQLPVVNKSRQELEEIEFIPFETAINTGVDMVLMAHIKLPELGIDVPASFSKDAVDILRDDWHYDGVIITDDLTMGAITENYEMEEVTVDAVKAGVDILMIAHEKELLEAGIEGLQTAVENGEITEDRIDESVQRILELKEDYDVDNQPVDSISVDELNEKIDQVYDEE